MELITKQVTRQTLIGPSEGYPVKRGNCFSVKCDDGNEYRIVNFNVENYDKCLELGVEDIKAIKLSERIAIIQDERIPDDWYDSRYCEVCCSSDLLPTPQKFTYDRKVARGEITKFEDYDIVTTNPYKETFPLFDQFRKKRTLNKKWTVELGEDIIEGDMFDTGLFYAPFIPNLTKTDVDDTI